MKVAGRRMDKPRSRVPKRCILLWISLISSMRLLLRMVHSQLRRLSQRKKRKHKALQSQSNRTSLVGNSAIPLLGQTIFLALIIGMQSIISAVLSTTSIERGIALRSLLLVLFLFLKDISVRLSGLKAGKRYGILMFHTPN
uniref:Uncharacterized protein n=1 Tax=Opuntia streptacantha TaxID=393608 RepID=A0A7C8YLF9_OPUST